MEEITEEEYEILREIQDMTNDLKERIWKRRKIGDVCDVETEDIYWVLDGIWAELWNAECKYENKFRVID